MTGPLPYLDCFFFQNYYAWRNRTTGLLPQSSLQNMFLGYTKFSEHIYKKLRLLVAPTQKTNTTTATGSGWMCQLLAFPKACLENLWKHPFSHHRRTTTRVAPLLLAFFPREMAPLNATAQVFLPLSTETSVARIGSIAPRAKALTATGHDAIIQHLLHSLIVSFFPTP